MDLFYWALVICVGLPLVGFGVVKFARQVPWMAGGLDAALVGDSGAVEATDPVEVEPEPIKKRDHVVLQRATIGMAVIELTQQFAVTAGVPRLRRRRMIVIRGYVTSDADARALGEAIKNYGPEL